MKTIILLVFFMGASLLAQENHLDPFAKLMGGRWVTEGKWSDGQPVRWMTTFEWGLNSKIVKVRHFGDDWNDRGEFGLRNEGIRAWDAKTRTIRFWEFDVLGGITTGDVVIERDTIHNEYDYEIDGKTSRVRDSWHRHNADTYDLTVSVLEGQKWKPMLQTVYKRHF